MEIVFARYLDLQGALEMIQMHCLRVAQKRKDSR
jgi:hypothetical protein